MPIDAVLVSAKKEIDQEIHEQVMDLLSKIILPRQFNKAVLKRYFRRALNNGAWYRLSKVERSLLWLTIRIIDKIKSPILYNSIKKILLNIEMNTFRAKALYHGLIIYMHRIANKINITIKEILSNIKTIFYLGLDHINNPQIYKIYG